MRTSTLLGLTAIADAINKNWISKETIPVICGFVIAAILMDFVYFIKDMSKD